MSIRQAARRWGVPAAALSTLAVPLLLAACPWDDLGGDEPWWFGSGIPGCEECEACYREFADLPDPYEVEERGALVPEPAHETVLPGNLPTEPEAQEGATETGGGTLPPTETGGGTQPPTETGGGTQPPTGSGRRGVPDAVLRPRVDPDLRNVPQTPNYPKPPPSTGKKY